VLSNNINSVPREARIEIDIRDIDLARRDSVVKSVLDKVKAVAEERGVTYSVDMINQDPPATSGDQVRLYLTALVCLVQGTLRGEAVAPAHRQPHYYTSESYFLNGSVICGSPCCSISRISCKSL
jgi:acetylornithine deacetylase/succinyl-diaminopimelate desuccinylase-like protein